MGENIRVKYKIRFVYSVSHYHAYSVSDLSAFGHLTE